MDWIVCYAMYINSGNSFAEFILVLCSLLQLWEKKPLSLNSSYDLLTANAWAPNWLNRRPKCLLGHLRYKYIRYVIYSNISCRHFTSF